MIVEITSPDDARVAAYRDVRERDLVGRQGRFVAESDGVLRTLLSRRSRFAIESLFLGEQRLAGLRPLLDRLDDAVPVFVAPRETMQAVAGFPIHRGVLAVGLRGADLTTDGLLGTLPDESLVLVLLGLTNHDNVGGIFRNASAFGADAVLLDPETCDPLYRKAIRVSVGSALTIPFARSADRSALLASLADKGFRTIALSPAGRTEIGEVGACGRTALLLGTEGPGLPQDVLRECRTARIPMAPGHDSLNVATASAIALYALRRGRAERDNGCRLPSA